MPKVPNQGRFKVEEDTLEEFIDSRRSRENEDRELVELRERIKAITNVPRAEKKPVAPPTPVATFQETVDQLNESVMHFSKLIENTFRRYHVDEATIHAGKLSLLQLHRRVEALIKSAERKNSEKESPEVKPASKPRSKDFKWRPEK